MKVYQVQRKVGRESKSGVSTMDFYLSQKDKSGKQYTKEQVEALLTGAIVEGIADLSIGSVKTFAAAVDTAGKVLMGKVSSWLDGQVKAHMVTEANAASAKRTMTEALDGTKAALAILSEQAQRNAIYRLSGLPTPPKVSEPEVELPPME